MTQVDMTLQGKGGVGKSYIASLLTQHYRAEGVETVCIDTDPVNATFSGYKAYGVKCIDLLDGDDVDPIRFDELMEAIFKTEGGRTAVIVDNGAATFVPLCSYMMESGAVAMLRDRGHRVRFHTVVTGGQGERDTIRGFDELCANFPGVDVVVWSNGFFGRISGGNGEGPEESAVYRKHEERVYALITIPAVRAQTFGRDIDAMLRRRLTFNEAIHDSKFYMMSRQRLTMYWRDMEERMKAADLCPSAGKAAPEPAAARP